MLIQHMSGALSPPGQRSAPDYYAKGKRQLDGAGRGHPAKAQRTDPDQNHKKGKGKSSSAHFPRFRDTYIPFLWKYAVHSHYDLYEHKSLPKKGVEFSTEKLETLLGATPTEDDVERSPLIIEAIRHSAQNADAFTYEMFDKHYPRDQSHTAYCVNSKGETLRMDDVNVSGSHRLLPMKDQQKYGNYWAILRRRPGATALTTPEYMPNAVYSFHDVNSDFRRAVMTLLHSRMWTEAPLNNFKISHLYPYADYMGGNKIYINKINQSLNLGKIPYKSELVYDAFPAERSKTGGSQLVKPRETMERLIELGVLPNDNKAILPKTQIPPTSIPSTKTGFRTNRIYLRKPI
jgi:hypothetical protein